MFKLHCDRCNQFIKDVGGPEAKEISLSGKTVCKECISKEEKFTKMADKLKRSWDSKINTLIAEAKKEITSNLEKI